MGKEGAEGDKEGLRACMKGKVGRESERRHNRGEKRKKNVVPCICLDKNRAYVHVKTSKLVKPYTEIIQTHLL